MDLESQIIHVKGTWILSSWLMKPFEARHVPEVVPSLIP